jgi:Tfp pilus assembly protein PilW
VSGMLLYAMRFLSQALASAGGNACIDKGVGTF